MPYKRSGFVSVCFLVGSYMSCLSSLLLYYQNFTNKIIFSIYLLYRRLFDRTAQE